MRRLLLLFLVPLLSPALAQEIAFSAGGARSDIGEDVAIDRANNVIVVGTFEGTAQFGALSLTAANDDPNTDWGDVFVVKYSALGAPLWARRAGTGVFNDFAEGVAVDEEENVYVAGFFTGIATFDGGGNPDVSLTTRNDFDAFLAKYDTDGDLLWVQQAGGPGQDTGRGVAVDGQGHVYFAGGFADTATFGADTDVTSVGSSDAFLAKYLPDGTLDWVRTGGSPQSDGAWSVALDELGAPYVVGTFRSVILFDGLPMQSAGLSDLFVAHYDTDGTVEWVEQIGADGSEYGRGIAVTFDKVVVTGSFENLILVGTDVLASAGFSDVLVAVLGHDGTLERGFRLGGAGFDFGTDVATTELETFATGYVEGAVSFTDDRGGGKVTAQGLDGYALTLYDASSGYKVGVELLGGPNADRGWGVGVYPDLLSVAYTGAFRDTGTFFVYELTSAGSNDVYVAARPGCGVCPALETETPPVFSLGQPAPNPARSRIEVEVKLSTTSSVSAAVLDVLGRRVALLYEGTLSPGTHAIAWAVGDQPSGLYTLRVTMDGHVYTRRLTILR